MRRVGMVFVAGLAVSLVAAADTKSPAIGAACEACHGGNGISISGEIPNLAGQKAGYLTGQLKAFKSGDRKHDLMNPIARQLSDADIGALATYWSSLPAAGSDHEATSAATLARKSAMTFPGEFPKGFTVYRTDEDAEAKGVSRYFANEIALQAGRSGKSLPIGSTIVVAMSAAKVDDQKQVVRDANGHLIPETPNFFSGMEFRKGAGDGVPELLRNGDWTYGLFNAKHERADNRNYAQCLACHKGVEHDSFVFTLKELAAKQ